MLKLIFLILTLNAIVDHQCVHTQQLTQQAFEPNNLKLNDNLIYLNEKAASTIRLKSVLSMNNLNGNSEQQSTKRQKIFWSFKRIFSMPKFASSLEQPLFEQTNQIKSVHEMSMNELMISLDAEVEENLKEKYSINTNQSNDFDLIINNLTYADSGLYKCNLWNQKTIYYHLIVTSPVSKPDLIIEKSPREQTNEKMINEKSNMTIKCLSKFAYPYPSMKWFRNNQEITRWNNDVSSSLNNRLSITYKLVDKETNTIETSLTIENITSDVHMNNYTCKLVQVQDDSADANLSNEQQLWQSSEQVVMNVAFKPRVHMSLLQIDSISSNELVTLSTDQLKSIRLYEDDNDVAFKCKYTANPNDNLKIVWKLNDQIQAEFNDVDTFTWAKRAQRGLKQANLTCEVHNLLGQSSITSEISILYEPKIVVDNLVFDVDEMSTLKVNCTTDSSPALDLVEWRRYDLQLTTVNQTKQEAIYRVVSNNSLLEIDSVKHTEDAGYYVCVAINSMNNSFGVYKQGEKSVRIEVNVRFTPQMNMIAPKQAANLSTSKHTLSCMAKAYPEPIFIWYKNGEKLNTSRFGIDGTKYTVGNVLMKSKTFFENTLVINELNNADLNQLYECEASNLLGYNRVQIELVPISKPDQPAELRSVFYDFSTISLAWSSSFDGGLEQTFILEINDTQYELSSQVIEENKFIRLGTNMVNLTNLEPNTVYNVRIQARNQLGSSEWTDYVQVRTNDITLLDVNQLPLFDALFLNVPRNRLEFALKESFDRADPLCLNVSTSLKDVGLFTSQQCKRVNLDDGQFAFDSDYLLTNSFNKTVPFDSNLVKSIKVTFCFEKKPSVCNLIQTNAIIDTYNKISHSSLLSNKKSQAKNSQMNPNEFGDDNTIPIALITGICICIVALLVLLLITVIYCIRKRNFKLCKSLLSAAATAGAGNMDDTKPCEKANEAAKAAHTNKSFNIDIASISAPTAVKPIALNGNPITISTDELTTAHSHSLNNVPSIHNSLNSRRAFTAALTSTANNIISNSLGKHKLTEILVTEDEEKQHNKKQASKFSSKKATKQQSSFDDREDLKSSIDLHGSNESNSTAISNCSSVSTANGNNHTNMTSGQFIYSDFEQHDGHHHSSLYTKGVTFIDTYNSGASSGSNSDPIAINNSLSSNSTTDSPIYGYNVSTGTNHHHLSNGQIALNQQSVNGHDEEEEDVDNLLYIKTAIHQHKTFPPLDENFIKNNFNKQHQQQPSNKTNINSNNNINNMNTNSNRNQLIEQPESGYSTPSRPKKVVYEVIV
jgi:hypothetical protein